jgi:hypothetical protein
MCKSLQFIDLSTWWDIEGEYLMNTPIWIVQYYKKKYMIDSTQPVINVIYMVGYIIKPNTEI